MKCPECQFENPDESVFCGKCGLPLEIEVVCPNCGSKAESSFRL
jgi:predicted amidophosphoribosyltransferase